MSVGSVTVVSGPISRITFDSPVLAFALRSRLGNAQSLFAIRCRAPYFPVGYPAVSSPHKRERLSDHQRCSSDLLECGGCQT